MLHSTNSTASDLDVKCHHTVGLGLSLDRKMQPGSFIIHLSCGGGLHFSQFNVRQKDRIGCQREQSRGQMRLFGY